ncbi:l domain-like protein [Diplodia corticola]|uniref:U2 small nuclear ribonucleoprotein A' n=1 Tax=Diplodia corticola TaxID=236234 RepID=A0A1J9S9J5_9PEZI|nr:l domain-like protein [Diplodia corticola]OJD36564.1 l domain-like protein [Diplodia corticola]
MRLTAEIIQHSLSYINPLGERELDLRGRQFTHIENMGAASADIECIDFTDNNIQMLGNLPHRPRVTTLLLARNRLSQIQTGIARAIPALTSLSLAENSVRELADLDPLGGFSRLTQLNLIGNPVCSKERQPRPSLISQNYRYYLIFRIPSLRFFDFQRVRDAERQKAKELFGTPDAPTELAQKVMSQRNTVPDVSAGPGADDVAGGMARVKLTDVERLNIQELIKNANTLDEITRLEKLLNEGKIPGQ